MRHIEFNTDGMGRRFEWVTQGMQRGPSDLFDVPLYSDTAAVALPSVGSLVPGWTLIVPRKATLNLAKLTCEERMSTEVVRGAVQARLKAAFDGRVYEFEHGPKTYGGVTGCGVDQAHLHIVPLPFDLLSASNTLDSVGAYRFSREDRDPWSRIPTDVDYWLIRDSWSGDGLIMFPRVATSQALRRLIAQHIGSSEWDYKKSSSPTNAEITRRAF